MPSTAMLIIGIILIVFAVFLVIAVLMQQGKSHNLSGTIAGGAETFFGKSKGQSISKKLSILTTIVAIIFVLLVVAVYVVNAPNDDAIGGADNSDLEEVVDEHDHEHEETTAATGDAETTAPAGDAETTAPAADAETTAPAADESEAADTTSAEAVA